MRILPFLLAFSACDLLPVDRITAHCDLRTGMDPRGYCQEWRDMADTRGNIVAVGLCETMGTEFVEAPCVDEDHIVAGCYIGRLGDGSESYWWFYDEDEDGNPVTIEDVQQSCESGGDDFVEWFPAE